MRWKVLNAASSTCRMRRMGHRRLTPTAPELMAIFLTGATGYIGSYLAAGLLDQHGESLNLLVRAEDGEDAQRRLWRSLQLHFDFPVFREHFSARMRIFCGDLTSPHFGLNDEQYDLLVASTDSVLH